MTDLLNGPTFELSPPPPIRKPWYRRAAVILPIVVALIAAAAIITVALLTKGGSASTPGTAAAAAQTTTPTAAPAPVRMAVTSALTGEPLAVTLGLPDGTTLSAGGSGTVAPDRVKPGDKVSVSAEGYITAPAQVGKDRMITVTLQPTFATAARQLLLWSAGEENDKIISYVLSPATGFQYEAMPPAGPGSNSSIAAKVVGKEAIVNISVDRGVVVNREFLKQFYGNTTKQITIAGQPAWHGSMDHGAYGTTWVRDPLLIDVNGSDLSTTDAVLTGIVTALPAK